MIREQELRKQVKAEGATATARKIKEALESGELSHTDFPSFKTLYETLVTEKGRDKEGIGHHLLQEHCLTEEAGNVTSIDAFNVVASQLFFNALTTVYNAADFNIAPLFRVIPSNLVRGETFAGISNLNQIMQETPEGRQLPSIEPTQDFSQSCPQRQIGGCIDITLSMIKGDRTGEIMEMARKLGESLATSREIEAVSTLTGLSGEVAGGGTYSRNFYNWKNVSYPTYQTATPWINVVTSNGLVNYENLQAAYLALQNITDPFTGLPIMTPPGRAKLICTPTNQFIAQRLARGIMYNTTPSVTNFSPQVQTDATPPVEFDVVSSKYLSYVLTQNSAPQTNWYFGYPSEAFSFQQMMGITVSEAIPNTGDLFRRNLAASYKAFRFETAYAFQPRYMVKNTA